MVRPAANTTPLNILEFHWLPSKFIYTVATFHDLILRCSQYKIIPNRVGGICGGNC